MANTLSTAELQSAQSLLQHYAPAQTALENLHQHRGNLEASLEDLAMAAAGSAVYGETDRGGGKTLRQVLLANLRRELCGDDSFREKVEEYNKNPAQAALLTGLIVYVVELVALPWMSPAIATVAVLWILKIGLRTFCDYTEPAETQRGG
ncbi:hypothetical protein [Leptolyngbya sp. BL0902]|uniref:hypothetical protein n=1 Tax=Leptolyngbya sp. BL0902 TaxID=1115757 RepID=UPI0018E76721|nr:hypothetical protein [Leptolyngbya sp. BL0902]